MTEWSQLVPDKIISAVCTRSKWNLGSWGCLSYPSLSLSVCKNLPLKVEGAEIVTIPFLPQFNFFFRFPLHQAVWKHLRSPVRGHPGSGRFGAGSSLRSTGSLPVHRLLSPWPPFLSTGSILIGGGPPKCLLLPSSGFPPGAPLHPGHCHSRAPWAVTRKACPHSCHLHLPDLPLLLVSRPVDTVKSFPFVSGLGEAVETSPNFSLDFFLIANIDLSVNEQFLLFILPQTCPGRGGNENTGRRIERMLKIFIHLFIKCVGLESQHHFPHRLL